ncbi:hypothetical protein [Parazoarcus communis]|nr:hypothetical protein [Parazoarcus communis]
MLNYAPEALPAFSQTTAGEFSSKLLAVVTAIEIWLLDLGVNSAELGD